MYLCIAKNVVEGLFGKIPVGRKNSALMLLIFVPKLTNRIGYTLKVLFRTVLHVDFEITSSMAMFENHAGPRLCYGSQRVCDSVWVKSVDLLLQTNVIEQEPHPFCIGDTAALYPVYGRDLDFEFDILAASFFMLSRYEEYLPHRRDAHHRFTAKESVAYQHGFLHTAVVERWAMMLAEKLADRHPDFVLPMRHFEMVNTIDIDAAYCYKHKGIARTLIGLGKDVAKNHNADDAKRRLRVLLRKEPDPFDTFDYIIDLKVKHRGIPMIFFVLLADYGRYDKNISYHVEEFQQLLKHLGDYAKLGIHSSYSALEDANKLDKEVDRLQKIVNRNIVRNRGHFLRLQLPSSYRSLMRVGIEHDYTMGFADEPGFRAGISTPYPFFNLNTDSEMLLTIHPFAIMEATLKRYKGMKADEAWPVYQQLMDEVYRVKGVFSCIWHNENLSECFGWEGWRKVYERMLDYGEELKMNSIES